jgi:MFS family permease
MSDRARLLLLGAFAGAALLVGMELLVTAVALPSIITDLADWTELRRASWVVNGYLVAYIAVMPLAGRAADRFGLPRSLITALLVFAAGSLLSGAAQSLDQLVAARLVQGLGGGAVVPLATAGASHLFSGHGRARALGVVGAATFLGMALGPFAGAAVLGLFDLAPALGAGGQGGSALAAFIVPAWRWILYLGAPLAVVAALVAWATAPTWPVAIRRGRLDLAGALLFTAALGAGLLALTGLGSDAGPGPSGVAVAAAVALLTGTLAVIRLLRDADPFLDLRAFRDRVFSSAVLVSVLTGYALATAIIGGAVFVDRVHYGGPPDQRLALGALAGAMAVGALTSGFALRHLGIVLVSLAGLLLGTASLLALTRADASTALPAYAAGLAVFGFGFGLSVTPRSTAAVEALGRAAFGMAAAAVTVARMIGMGIGLAVLTAFGSNRIEALSVVLVDAAARDAVLPPALRGRPLEDTLVVDALERWAAGEAAAILAGLFTVAALIMLMAVAPALLMRRRTAAEARQRGASTTIGDDERPGSADDDASLAL